MARFDLSLKPRTAGERPPGPRRQRQPVLGWLAVGFATLGIVTWAIPFVPLAFLLSLLALLFGQWNWGILGLFLSIFGLVTSPVLMALIGFGTFVWLLDLPTLVPPSSPPGPGISI